MQRHNELACLSFFSRSQARNSQELINSTTGVVLAPEVQPGPHQVMALSMGQMFLPFFAKPGPYFAARYAGAMGIK